MGSSAFGYDARPMQRVPAAEFPPELQKRLEALWGHPPNLYRALTVELDPGVRDYSPGLP